MDDRKAVLSELDEIIQWSARPLLPCHSNDDYMTIAVELMVRTLTLLRLCASLAPSEAAASRGVPKRRAIVVGLLVRMTKLYHGLLMHVIEKQKDLCTIFDRLILETESTLVYLMRSRRSSFRHFVQGSYRPEKEMLADLKQKRSNRKLIPIESRMLASVQGHLRQDRISARWLRQNKTWDLDGKSFRARLAAIGRDWGYAYGFGIGSHWIHGDWFDIKTYQITKNGRFYSAKIGYQIPDPRNVCPTTVLCLGTLLCYLKWSKTDPDMYVATIVEGVRNVALALNHAHEASLQEKGV